MLKVNKPRPAVERPFAWAAAGAARLKVLRSTVDPTVVAYVSVVLPTAAGVTLLCIEEMSHSPM